MALTVHSTSSEGSVRWGLSKSAHGASTPLDALSPRDRNAQGQAVPKPLTARCPGTTYDGLQKWRPTMTVSCASIRCATLSSASATSASCSWSTLNTTGTLCCLGQP